MGQKVHPTGFRLGINKTWDSKWYAKKNFAKFLHEDLQIRKFVRSRLERAGVSKIEIERASDNLRVNIYSSRPGIVIGKRGSEIDRLKDELKKIISKNVTINTFEIKKAEIDSQLVAENVALQLERRIAFRRAMKKNVASALRFGAQGIKIRCSGRLGGAEIARTEWFREGRVPLHTLRADVDYGFAEARTTYGIIGVKVWIYKGEILPERVKVEDKAS
ncbi:MAG: 30S ribosomal protein S3 [Candidatus Schekmanbacteria bacterium RBG_16_38_11]|uniref:Small ribosomal subunit protein uS3 n=2 Tax=Candidatus Schekmaniibacteriota TaxID=1817811 RepID=A0A1F7RI10_9BACT|nr:MAG: 30S ribosomal protein S3 [Candidatus Schekmanbacteria bacterium GWA2_38_11]OGL44167.1 MAG: 30S ribosomal protein S3 [Candidatus Schekmanbacteria bacterium RBG_16_38_11]